MKNTTITILFILVCYSVYAQWSGGIDTNTPIWRNGKVGIGTSTPTYALSLVSASQEVLSVKSSSHSIINIESGSGLNSYIRFSNNGIDRWDLASETYGNLRIYDYLSAATRFAITPAGNVGIGTSAPDAKLAVNGTIHSREVKVDLNNWPDYVFNSDYKLPSLLEVESYIKQNKHLPEVPSEAEVREHGINLGEMNALLLKKVEELTLYILQQQKQIDKQNQEIEKLKQR